jgi:hypothetical protein
VTVVAIVLGVLVFGFLLACAGVLAHDVQAENNRRIERFKENYR